MKLHVHVHHDSSKTSFYSKAELKREIESIESRLKYNAIGLERARGARRYSYKEEKAELEKELAEFKQALENTK